MYPSNGMGAFNPPYPLPTEAPGGHRTVASLLQGKFPLYTPFKTVHGKLPFPVGPSHLVLVQPGNNLK